MNRSDWRGVKVFSSNFMMTNTVVIWGPKFVAVHDPAFFPDEVERIKQLIIQLNRPNVYFFYTHFDYDHIIDPAGINAYRIATEEIKQRDNEQELRNWQDLDNQLYVERKKREFPAPDYLIASSEERIEFAGEEVIAYKVPGHTVDSLLLHWPSRQLIVAGDILSDKEIPVVDFSVAAYLESLTQIQAILTANPVRILVPGHGHAAVEEEITKRLQRDIQYLKDLQAMAVKIDDSESLSQDEWRRTADLILYDNQPVSALHHKIHVNNLRCAVHEFKR